MKLFTRRFFIISLAVAVVSKLVSNFTRKDPLSKYKVSTSETKNITVAFLLVGSRDEAYSKSHFDAANLLKEKENVSLIIRENVKEDDSAIAVIEDLISNGVDAIFLTSFGHFQYAVDGANKHPNVQFYHSSNLVDTEVHPKNLSAYYAQIIDAVYVCGVVAGGMTRSLKVGYIAPIDYYQAYANANAFFLGASKSTSEISLYYTSTDEWTNPEKEIEAAKSLISAGVDVIMAHVDEPKYVANFCKENGIFYVGYHTNMESEAGDYFLTGAQWNWAVVYSTIVDMISTGKSNYNGDIPNLMTGSLGNLFCRVSNYGKITSRSAIRSAEETRQNLVTGDEIIFLGPLNKNDGSAFLGDGIAITNESESLQSMDFLLEGVISEF